MYTRYVSRSSSLRLASFLSGMMKTTDEHTICRSTPAAWLSVHETAAGLNILGHITWYHGHEGGWTMRCQTDR